MARRFTEDVKFVIRDADASTKDTLIQGNVSTAWIDMKGFDFLTAIIFRTVGTGSVQDANISVSAASTGTSAAVVTSSGSTECTGSLLDATPGKTGTAGAGIIILEATFDEMIGALATAQFAAVKISVATATDEFGIIYMRSRAREGTANLTQTANG
jgi:hypothetical protein